MNRSEVQRAIVETEWEMFQNVKGIGGRADCQDDNQTFLIMRLSQFDSWEDNVLQSYLQDLMDAKAAGRNLVMEKYAHMMEETDPAYYEQIRKVLPPVDDVVIMLADVITERYIAWEKEVDEKYPNVRKFGRPAEETSADGTVSIRNYLRSELKTYSKRTLTWLLASIDSKPDTNRYLVSMQKIARAYGYASLAEAEQSLAQRMAAV